MSKRALVIGINDYSNWNNASPISAQNLSWAVADATSFGSLLKDAFGFDEVGLLQDSQATSQAMVDGMRSLLSRSQAGDVMCMYFSGHGGRLPQDGSTPPNRDSVLGSAMQLGRYYETLIPYDCPAMVTSAQIASITRSLLPSQVNFTGVLDCCHSGEVYLSPAAGSTSLHPFGPLYRAGLRGFLCDEASLNEFVRTCQTVVPHICLLDPSSIDGNVSNLARSGNGVSMSVDASKDTPDDARAILLSACDYNENAGESADYGHGFFTYAILDTVNRSGFQMNYSDLLTTLRAKVAKLAGGSQTPQLRGRPGHAQESFLKG